MLMSETGWCLTLVACLAAGSSPAIGQCDPHEAAKLLADDGNAGDAFGRHTSLSGDTALVGAHQDDDRGTNAGAAYVFERPGGVWTQAAKLTAADGATDDEFGWSVAVSGDTALVGAHYDDDLGDGSGSAYVFERIGDVWMQASKLTASDGAELDFFGTSVSVSASTAAVGATGDDDHGEFSGSVYVFERLGGVWTHVAKLTSSDGAPGDAFGHAVAISDGTIVLGAPGDDDYTGSVYLFERVGGEWTQTAKLVASDGMEGDRFGGSVSLDTDAVLVGSRQDDELGTDSGAAYVFERSGGGWTEVAKLTASDGKAHQLFGWSVSLSAGVAVAGKVYDSDNGDTAGAAYVFERLDGDWAQAAKLLASDGAANDWFGISVAVSGDTALAGSFRDDDNGSDSGSAYVFDLNCACPADVNGDGNLNILDFVAFQLLWQAADPTADCDANAEFNVLDFVCFQQLFVQGCE